MQCSEPDIYTIAGYDLDWRRVGRRLLSEHKVRDIDKEGGSEDEKREKILLEWRRTKARDATYEALVKVLRTLLNNTTANLVEELNAKARLTLYQGNVIPPPPPPPPNDTPCYPCVVTKPFHVMGSCTIQDISTDSGIQITMERNWERGGGGGGEGLTKLLPSF